ncbi:MAG: alcohol dehydrogenase catalytic domain-containing protein [Chloroflexi bacterium]|nr:alcohol dehydrogenase catalytic domain-containing protein [Chloroflexota bacterium]
MKAAILKEKGRFSVLEIPTPEPGPGEVLVKVSYCAVCGSDRRRFSRGEDTGLILGHEFCGRIARIGDGVKGWAVGDRVAVDPSVQCDSCYSCLHGYGNICSNRTGNARAGYPGAYAEYVTSKSLQLFLVPAAVDEQEITMAQCLAVTLHAFRQSQMRIGDRVIVIGAGPIGLLMLACARLAGAGAVYVIGKGQGRKALAVELGADAVLDPSEADRRERLLNLAGAGADVVYGCAGDAQAVRDCLALVKGGGTVVIVGSGWETLIQSREIVEREVTVKGSKSYLRSEFGEAVDMISGGRINCRPFITSVVPLVNIQQAFEEMERSANLVKTLIAP